MEEERTSYVRSVFGTVLLVALALGHLALSLHYFSLTGARLLANGTLDLLHDRALFFCVEAGLLEFLLGTLSLMGVLPTVLPEEYRLLGMARLITILHLIPLMSMAIVGPVAAILTALSYPLIFPESTGVAACLRPITQVGLEMTAKQEAVPVPAPALIPGPVSPTTALEDPDSSRAEHDESSSPHPAHYAPTPFLPLGLVGNTAQRQKGNK